MKAKFQLTLGISAGISGYKMVDFVKNLQRKNISVSVVMTENATRMFPAEMFSSVNNVKVCNLIVPDNFDYRPVIRDKKVEHISLADKTDVFLIAPATANIIGKAANGIADDYLTTLILAVTCPGIFAPSMNSNMWANSAVQENLKKLKKRGYFVINPDRGDLACGYTGVGRLKNTGYLEVYVSNLLEKRKQLLGKKILITSGATRQPIDQVRSINSEASGKMGKFLAEACYKRGAQVLLLRSQNSAETDYPFKQVTFSTVSDLSGILEKYSPLYDIIFHSSAVSDFIPDKTYKGKLTSSESFTVTFNPGEKIINKIKKWHPGIILIGFKAVFNPKEADLKKSVGDLFEKSRSDCIIINNVGRLDIGFASDYNEVKLVTPGGSEEIIKKNTKEIIAESILDALVSKKII